MDRMFGPREGFVRSAILLYNHGWQLTYTDDRAVSCMKPVEDEVPPAGEGYTSEPEASDPTQPWAGITVQWVPDREAVPNRDQE